jgi:uncharacterized membrane protein HdeD (DUF308 family)
MTVTQTESWQGLALRGLAALAFGVLTLLWPGITLTALIFLFGAYALLDGVGLVVAIATGDRAPGSRWGLTLVQGVAGIAAGVVTFVWPDITALALLYVIGIWAILTGVMEVFAATFFRREVQNEWVLVISGVLSVFFGALLLLFPGAGALTITWLIGWYALVYAVLALSLAGWHWRQTHPSRGPSAAPGVTA